MEDWDQETLEKVVKEKHGAEKPSNATNIICRVRGAKAEGGVLGVGCWGMAKVLVPRTPWI
jgi:hypothetical protein